MRELLLVGVPDVKSVQGAAAGTSVDLQPSAGEQWVVAWAQGSHDDVAAQTCGFTLNDGTTTANVGPGVSIAGGLTIPLYMTNPDGVAGKAGMEWALPLVLNEKMKLTLASVAMGAGKKLKVEALVYVFRGTGPWGEPV